MVTTLRRPGTETGAAQETATRLALVIEYDGTHYFGMQLQSRHSTIQSELEKALHALTGEKIRVAASSRTDTGVHARGQVISFLTENLLPLEAYIQGLNHHLPEDIAVKAAFRVPLKFDARRMASSREYTYTILNRATRSPLGEHAAYRMAGNFDIDAMNEACRGLLGTHDFASFASAIADEPEKSTIRKVLSAEVKRNGELIVFTIVANAFVRHQIRSTAGALAQVGLGKITVAEFIRLLAAKEPGLAGPTLPAHGLCLVRVNYPFTFEEMKQ
ncbi:MAG TPA: tRNA pseudouridine(38-40) synthase TruA [Dehalococcoidales bacterium]|nr:tRNA pseudouridine(38-40) synthase TruA [Dehalococcoidales bacterium]